jgi:hypothetical protein
MYKENMKSGEDNIYILFDPKKGELEIVAEQGEYHLFIPKFLEDVNGLFIKTLSDIDKKNIIKVFIDNLLGK